MINERILEFLDGSLSHEEEAELLHTLSVSPEKRNLLRGYMNQGALIARDKQSITVPYMAEQMLWQRMAAVLPVVPMATAPTAAAIDMTQPVAGVGIFSRLVHSTSSATAAATLIVGLGVGYLLGTNTTETTQTTLHTSAPAPTAPLASAVTAPEVRYITKYIRVPVAQAANTSSTLRTLAANTSSNADIVADRTSDAPNDRNITTISPRGADAPVLLAVGGEPGIPPYMHDARGYGERPKTLLERFEFGVMENFGREYPNTAATNSSLPIITNSAVTTFFQVSPNSTKYWAGAAFGTANFAKKTLYTRAGNKLDRMQDVLVADTVHSQSSYVAAYLQYRVPAFVGDLTFTAGYGLATLGQMLSGEIGMHYDISREVGLQFALRGTQFYYNLSAERQAAVNSGSGSLVIPKGIDQATPSFNLDLGTGLYFHF
jgi:hypothetical protein